MATRAATTALALLLLAAATLTAAAPRRALWNKDLQADPFCPWNAVKFGVCAGVLGAVGVQGGASLGSKCCDLVSGLPSAEAAACLCVSAKESVLGIPAEWSVGVGVLASACKTELPDGFKCV